LYTVCFCCWVSFKSPLSGHIFQERNLSALGYGGTMISRDRNEMIVKFLHRHDVNIMKVLQNYIFPVLSHLNYKLQNSFLPRYNIYI
jgi:hypothetical protein